MKKIILITMLMSAVFAQSDCNESNWEDYYNSDGKDMSDCDLRDANLTGVKLIGANLTGAKLANADLKGAQLWGADLTGADLERADLTNADLERADLRGADLRDAQFRDADLRGADLTGADLERADLRRMKLIDADLTDANLIGADLERADLTNADLERANLTGADLTDASLTGADLTDATLGGADLRGADLTGAQLNGVKSGFNIGRPLSLPDGWSLVDGKFELIKEPIVYQDVHHYICFNGDDNSMVIWVSYSREEKALEVKYKGQDKAMQLVQTKGDSRFPGAYVVSDDYYKEMVDGKENGQYKITHSGNWVYVEYRRGTDGKIFKFTIDHNANPYGKEPCF
jgi:uncharacterized protein YjbI with pentapeptide repeats